MNTTEVFAERFKQLRTDKGLSLQKIAQDLDVTAQSLSLYEKGQRTINIDLLKRIAEYFGVSSDYLIGLSDVAATNTELKAACDYTGLSEKAVTEIVKNKNDPLFFMFLNYVLSTQLDENGIMLAIARYTMITPTKGCFAITDYGDIRPIKPSEPLKERDIFSIDTETIIKQAYMNDICEKIKALKINQKGDLNNGKHNTKKE